MLVWYRYLGDIPIHQNHFQFINKQQQAGDLRIAQNTAFPWGQKWEPKDPNGALKQTKNSPDVNFGQHDQPTLKLWTLQLENGDFKIDILGARGARTGAQNQKNLIDKIPGT